MTDGRIDSPQRPWLICMAPDGDLPSTGRLPPLYAAAAVIKERDQQHVDSDQPA